MRSNEMARHGKDNDHYEIRSTPSTGTIPDPTCDMMI